MTTFLFANNISTNLAGSVSTSATTITLASAANLPGTIPFGSVLVLTLNDVATRGNFEVIYATARSGTTLTVERAQEGTAALSWLTGDYVYSGPTAGQQESFGQEGAANTWTGANTFNEPVSIGNATAPGEAITLGQAESDFAAINGSASQVFNVAQATTSTEALPLGQLPSEFPSSLNTSGYKKFPDPNSPSGYYIEQWGTFNGITSSQTLTLPLAFPNNFIQVNATDVGANCYSYGSVPISASQFNLFISTTAAHSGTWIARGY
jgi:hypothetical protein